MNNLLKLRFWHSPKIFITYRRMDTDGHTGRLYGDLIKSFPKRNVFFDIRTLEGGDEVFEEIEKTIQACEVLIAVIGRNWLTIKEGDRRRLDDPEDFVRREIAIALKRKILVVPLLVQGADLPEEEDLPEELQALIRRNAMVLSDHRWDYDVNQLINRLKRVARLKDSTPGPVITWQKVPLVLVGSAILGLGVWGSMELLSSHSLSPNTNNINIESNRFPQTTNNSLPAQSAPTPALSELKVYFGNLHAHTAYSDGSGTPEEAYHYARNQGALDFLAITDHNHSNAERGLGEVPDELADRLKDGLMIATDPNLYTKTIQDATRNTKDDEFVALYGQEYSTISSGNHVNVYSAESVIDVPSGSFDVLYGSWLPNHAEVPFIQFNHPWQIPSGEKYQAKHYGLDDYGGNYERLRDAVARYLTLIEVISGPAFLLDTGQARLEGEKFYQFYLTRGFRIAPTAGQDNHFRTWGTATDARTAVLAKRLTRRDLIEGLKSRRCYATTDKNLRVWFTVNRAVMGSEIEAQRAEIRVDYIIDDGDEPNANYEVIVVSGSPEIPDSSIETSIGTGKGKHQAQKRFNIRSHTGFIYLKIKQTSQDAPQDVVVTSPVWVKVKT